MSRRRFLTGNGTFGLLVLAAVYVCVGCTGCNSAADAVGKQVTLVHLEPLTPGASPVETADLPGKVVVINYWATWCGPCVAEFPHIAALAKSYRNRPDFQLLSVATGHSSPDALRSETETFLKRGGYDLAVYSDPGGRTLANLPSVPTSGIPLTIVLDRDVKIAQVIVGYSPERFEEMKLLIASLLQRHDK